MPRSPTPTWAGGPAGRRAGDARFSFGTRTGNALGGFAGAILLAGFALLMAFESVNRLFNPVTIVFDQAIVVAVAELLINGASMLVLGGYHEAITDTGKLTHTTRITTTAMHLA